MQIGVIGAGYVGLVVGAGFSEFGVNVVCADCDKARVKNLERGVLPFHEPGLEQLVAQGVAARRLTFTTDTAAAVRAAQVVFIAVGTPVAADGRADLSALESAAREIGAALQKFTVVAVKSTVPPGGCEQVRRWIEASAREAGLTPDFSVASTPEFLREGAAISDFLHPNRIVIGAADEAARALLRELYRPFFLNETPFVMTDIASAELIKYAANAFLATKISFINEMANLCEVLNADVQVLARGIGLDRRIGEKFLHAGPGFGGSCLPKDTRCLARVAREKGAPLEIIEAATRVNAAQRQRMVEKIRTALGGSVEGCCVGVLGLSFKPETDDLREAPALDIIRALAESGARVRAFDPVARSAAARLLPEATLCDDAYQVCEGADALVIVTEWNAFRMLDLPRVRALLRRPLVVDLRNIYEPEPMRAASFEYLSVGR